MHKLSTPPLKLTRLLSSGVVVLHLSPKKIAFEKKGTCRPSNIHTASTTTGLHYYRDILDRSIHCEKHSNVGHPSTATITATTTITNHLIHQPRKHVLSCQKYLTNNIKNNSSHSIHKVPSCSFVAVRFLFPAGMWSE